MTEPLTAENLACPFCNGVVDPQGWMNGDGEQGPECEDCGATAPTMSRWNTRLSQPPQDAQELIDAVKWVLNDAAYKAPEQHTMCWSERWSVRLRAALDAMSEPPSQPPSDVLDRRCDECDRWLELRCPVHGYKAACDIEAAALRAPAEQAQTSTKKSVRLCEIDGCEEIRQIGGHFCAKHQASLETKATKGDARS